MVKAKRGTEVEPGDIIWFLGAPHRVERIEPYDTPCAWGSPSGWRIARCEGSWTMTLQPQVFYEVV
jgi:hypothetical protein